MDSDHFPADWGAGAERKPEVPAEVHDALVEGVKIAISEQRMATTTNDLVRTPWLMQMVVDRAMAFAERLGISLEGFEDSASHIISKTLSELLPEEPDLDPDSGDREPRKPISPSLIGGVALALPQGSAEAAQ